MFKVNNKNIRTMALTKKGTDIRRKTEGHEIWVVDFWN